MRSARLTVLLVAHGSRDPRAAASTEALARAVRRSRRDWDVRASYLDHAGPRPLDVLSALPAGSRVVVVPLLLTAAYHGRVDVPAVVEAAATLPIQVTLAEVLGPTDRDVSGLLLGGLIQRLPVDGLDGVVLAAAGTRDAAARETITWAAEALSARLSLPCAVAYASGALPRPGGAVSALRGRVGMAAYFLAPGYLYDLAVRSALDAGAVAIAPPLGDAPDLVRLVISRVAMTQSHYPVAA